MKKDMITCPLCNNEFEMKDTVVKKEVHICGSCGAETTTPTMYPADMLGPRMVNIIPLCDKCSKKSVKDINKEVADMRAAKEPK